MKAIKYIKNCFGLYFTNKDSYDYIDSKITWQKAFVYSIIFSFIMSTIMILVESISNTESNFFVKNLVGLILTSVLYLPIVMIIIQGVIFFMLKFFNGDADFFDTLKFGLSLLNFLTFVIVIMVLILTKIPQNIFILNLFIYLFLILVPIWGIIVFVKVFSKLHSISKLKTTLALFMPILIMIGVALLIFIIMILFMGATF